MTEKIEYTEIGVNFIKAKTENALLAHLVSGDEKWIPLSLIRIDYKDVEVDDQNLDLPVATWFVNKEGLE